MVALFGLHLSIKTQICIGNNKVPFCQDKPSKLTKINDLYFLGKGFLLLESLRKMSG